MSLAKLTSLSTQTLSLLLERQRLQGLPSFSPSSTTTPQSTIHLPQITRNLRQLRSGIIDLEGREGPSEAVGLLRNQYERMRSMLGVDGAELESLSPPQEEASRPPAFPIPSNSIKDSNEGVYTRYTDDPEGAYDEPGVILDTQRLMMNDQDEHLDRLSHSINRQRDISLRINDELEVHSGLLEELDIDVDHTAGRLSGARRRLDRVAKGAKENSSTVAIASLILVLLILIIVFKT